MLALSSCGPDNTDYTEKVVGEYNIKITPNISVKYGNSILPIATEVIETTAVITAKDEEGNVTMQINGVNGEFSELFFEGYCDGLGLKFENVNYDGVLYSPEYGMIYCDIELKSPTVSKTARKNLAVFFIANNPSLSSFCHQYLDFAFVYSDHCFSEVFA